MKEKNNFFIQWPFIIGVSLIIAALVFGIFFYQSRNAKDFIRVTGAATERHVSDVIKWNVTLAHQTGLNNKNSGYIEVEKDIAKFTAYLKKKGVSEKNITVMPANSNSVYGHNEIIGYRITQVVSVIQKKEKMDLIADLALNFSKLNRLGLNVTYSNVAYYFANTTEMKRELLVKATEDARCRAEKIAEKSGRKVGKIMNARTGVIQIRQPYSTEVSGYGLYNTATREKDVTVTMSASFELK